MAPMSGDRLGSYEIIEKIGEGGMGEVYCAHDLKLKRDVALKVLPAVFASDPERMARFQREAQVLASLNHSNIAAIYGIEEFGTSNALVMELVAGPTLADRIRTGPLPMDAALPIAREIAAAIEYAHEHGVIHRDLKPANIKVRNEGPSAKPVVKILDFGLAKALDSRASQNANSARNLDPELSPTMSLGRTAMGEILGTPAYMPPEQVKGYQVDRRADIWAFGIVLFEMLTGQRAFTGATSAEVMASAMKDDPNLDRLPSETPRFIRHLIERCLNKDPLHRLQAIGEARIILSDPLGTAPGLAEQNATSDSSSQARSSIASRLVPWGVAALLAVGLALVGFKHFREAPPETQSLRFEITTPGSSAVLFPTLSPDGTNLVFFTSDKFWIHSLQTGVSRELPNTESATYPFWSPDGTLIAFFQGGKLKKMPIAGGLPQTLCDAPNGRGGTWNKDGVILFSANPVSPILRVSSNGGTPVAVTKLVGNSAGDGHRFPVFLPDGIHFLYQSTGPSKEEAGVFVGDLGDGRTKRVHKESSNALYSDSSISGQPGVLLTRRGDTLIATPFDTKQFKEIGEATPIAENVPLGSTNTGFGAFTVSSSGLLIYRTDTTIANRELAWLDRAGKRVNIFGKLRPYGGPIEISPDEKSATVRMSVGTRENSTWQLDFARNVLTKLNFRYPAARSPLWSPDGKSFVYATNSQAFSYNLFLLPVGGGIDTEKHLVQVGTNGFPQDWSSDGRYIVYQQEGGSTATDLLLLPMKGQGQSKPIPYLQTSADEKNGRFSPDGHWLAYQSNESGQYEIYIQAVPVNGMKWQISTEGGQYPTWRGDGRELYFLSPDAKLMTVPMKVSSTIEPGAPAALFEFPFTDVSVVTSTRYYAPSRDGKRFLVIADSAEKRGPRTLTAVTNWQAALKKQ